MDQLKILDALLQALEFAKSEEAKSRESRISVENKIIDLIGAKEEGSQTTTAYNYKVTTTGKLSRRMNWQQFDQVAATITLPIELLPIKTSREIDVQKLATLEREYPEIYANIAECITVKPMKTAITVKSLEIENYV